MLPHLPTLQYCSNEILLQQRLKRNPKWNIHTPAVVQMKFYYNKDWNHKALWFPMIISCSNEILLQQRLKLCEWFQVYYVCVVQMKFYYNKDWNYIVNGSITGFDLFKWNSITTKIETGTTWVYRHAFFSSNEILLQQRLKLNPEVLDLHFLKFKWNSITTKIETPVWLYERHNLKVQMKFYYNKDWNFCSGR